VKSHTQSRLAEAVKRCAWVAAKIRVAASNPGFGSRHQNAPARLMSGDEPSRQLNADRGRNIGSLISRRDSQVECGCSRDSVKVGHKVRRWRTAPLTLPRAETVRPDRRRKVPAQSRSTRSRRAERLTATMRRAVSSTYCPNGTISERSLALAFGRGHAAGGVPGMLEKLTA